MSQKQVTIVATGAANIGSVVAAFERIGAKVSVTRDANEILTGEHVVVPGVGTFGSAMDALNSNGLVNVIKTRCSQNLSTIFICVGLQILFEESEESSNSKGICVFNDLKITRFPSIVTVPQHGWNIVTSSNKGFVTHGFAYFSNSYKMSEEEFINSRYASEWTISTASHGDKFIAALQKGRLLACQFHPELSGSWGQQVLKRWINNENEESNNITEFTQKIENLINNKKTCKTVRIIPCLDVKDGNVVKGVQFQNLQIASDKPSQRTIAYEQQGADEIVVLDISATIEGRATKLDTVKSIRKVLNIPLTVGGGVQSIEDAQKLLESGADKVAINTAAVKKPSLINEMAEKYGRQCTILSIDTIQSAIDKWEVVVSAGKEKTGKDAIEWAKEGVERGAGEILLTSWDRDGTKSGYDLPLIKAISSVVSVPIIASGGAATSLHMALGVKNGADAVLAASIFHYEEYTVGKLKEELLKQGILVRL